MSRLKKREKWLWSAKPVWSATSIIGTLIGAMMLGVLNNGLNMMGVSPYVQNIIKGLIILFAIYISRERRTKR